MKHPFIKKINESCYRIYSGNGNHLRFASSKEEAMGFVSNIISKDKINFSFVENLSFSAVMRKLRQLDDQKIVLLFLRVYNEIFEKSLLSKKNNATDLALKVALRAVEHQLGINFKSKEKPVKFSIPRFGQVNETLFRGAAPSVSDVESLKENLGITKIVSLDLDSGLKINEVCKKLGIQHINIPLFLKNPKQMESLLSIDWVRLLLDGGPCFVHCLHGKDRTGFVLACFRCQEGWSPERALAEADKFDFCKDMRPSVKKYLAHLLRKKFNNEDTNKVWELPSPDFAASYVFNNEYQPDQPNFAITTLQTENANGFREYLDDYAPISTDERVSSNIPAVGLNDNVSNITVPGPMNIGNGFSTTI